MKKTSNEYHLICVRMSIMKKTSNNTCWGGFGEKGTLVDCWCRLLLSIASRYGEQFGGSSKNKKWSYHIWSSDSVPGYVSEENENIHLKRYMHPSVHSSIICSSQDREANELSINRGMDKEDRVNKYNGILLSHKKEWKFAICNNRDGPWRYDNSEKDRERQIPFVFTYMWNLKKKKNKWNRNGLADREGQEKG